MFLKYHHSHSYLSSKQVLSRLLFVVFLLFTAQRAQELISNDDDTEVIFPLNKNYSVYDGLLFRNEFCIMAFSVAMSLPQQAAYKYVELRSLQKEMLAITVDDWGSDEENTYDVFFEICAPFMIEYMKIMKSPYALHYKQSYVLQAYRNLASFTAGIEENSRELSFSG